MHDKKFNWKTLLSPKNPNKVKNLTLYNLDKISNNLLSLILRLNILNKRSRLTERKLLDILPFIYQGTAYQPNLITCKAEWKLLSDLQP